MREDSKLRGIPKLNDAYDGDCVVCGPGYHVGGNAGAERDFSKVTWMSTGRRSRLSPEVLDDLMVVNILGKPIQYYYCRPG